jgi:arylsulfatase
MQDLTRRGFLKTIGLGAAAVGLSGAGAAGAGDAGGKRPNVVLMMVDDMGFADLGCYGGEINTPTLDKLAAGGMRFTQFYNTAKCSPTRASLLSGCYHREVGEKKLANCITLGEAMRSAGYTTLMTGKWHLGSNPVARGFDRYFGHLSGATNFFKGDSTFRLDDKPFKVPGKGFYTTDANVDYAMKFLDQAVGKGGGEAKSKEQKPFFLYIAFNAPHYPLQAWPEDIAKYKGKFMAGWDELRKQRHARQLKMGLLKPKWKLAPRDASVKAWDSLSDAQKRIEDLTMAVYAAMIDRVDQNIARLLVKLKALGVADNTLLLFLSDNGGCPFQRTKTPNIPPGPANSYWTYHKGWAQVSNTPFRLYKQNQHEGGVSTPLIAHWPGVIKAGTMTDQAGHLVDIMATLLDITGTKYPESVNGQKLRPLRGKSLLPIFQGKQREGHKEIFFEFARYKALRAGKWKISWQGGPWELYDLEADRTELNNLADKMPEKVAQLAKRHQAWLKELGGGKGKGSRKRRK